jgi:riboflavin synthase
VLGHVDGVGRVESIRDQGKFSLWRFQAPAEVACYLVPKGSVAVDGISLTVIEPDKGAFGAAVIPETLRKTVLGSRHIGDLVNIEADILGKHVFHYMKGTSGGPDMTMDFLARHGYL